MPLDDSYFLFLQVNDLLFPFFSDSVDIFVCALMFGRVIVSLILNIHEMNPYEYVEPLSITNNLHHIFSLMHVECVSEV
jgi:hypothetical protein